MSDLSTLRRQLERLAADAPLTVPDRQLWRRGLRQARLRRGGSAVIVALVLLAMVAIGGLAHIRSQPQPASPHGSGGIPSRLYAPSGWLPSTTAAGPIGPLAVLAPAKRSHLWAKSSDAYIGVSTTGVYRFIDLPGFVPDTITQRRPSLSPDGRSIAYPIGHRSHGRPYAFEKSGIEITDGIGILDTTTGTVRRVPVPSPHGIGIEELSWLGDGALYVAMGHVLPGDVKTHLLTGVYAPSGYVLRPGSPLERLPLAADSSGGEFPDVAGTGAVLAGKHAVLLENPTASAKAWRKVRAVGAVLEADPVLDPTERRLAVVVDGPGPEGAASAVAIGAVSDAAIRFSVVPKTRSALSIVGWIDEGHVAVQGAVITADDGSLDEGLAALDLVTGRMRALTRFTDAADVGEPHFAADLVTRAPIDAPPPPRPWNPAVAPSLEAGVLLVGLALLVGWRRRVRA